MGKLLSHSSQMKVRDRRVVKWGPTSGSMAANQFPTNELIIEFWESYDDAGATVDAQYTGGTITISYGTLPTAMAMVWMMPELGPDTDCDASGVLDVCEDLTDCDANGVPDVCEGYWRAQRSVRKCHWSRHERTSDRFNTECAGEEATFGDQCNTSAFTGDGPDVFYSPSVLPKLARLICGLVTLTTTPTCRSTTRTVRSWCAMVIPAMTKRPTVACNMPHDHHRTGRWRLRGACWRLARCDRELRLGQLIQQRA